VAQLTLDEKAFMVTGKISLALFYIKTIAHSSRLGRPLRGQYCADSTAQL
jgi:hypothetical protein